MQTKNQDIRLHTLQNNFFHHKTKSFCNIVKKYINVTNKYYFYFDLSFFSITFVK